MNLVPKLSLAFIAGVSVILAVNGYLRVRREVALFESDRVRDDVLIGETLAPAIAAVWRTEGRDRALAVLGQASAHEHRVKVVWTWLDGSQAVPIDVGAVAALTPGASLTQVAPGPSGASGEDRRYTFLRVAVPDPRPGALGISEPLAPERAYVHQTIVSTVATTLTLDVVCAILAMILGAWIVGRPVAALGEKARRVGRGDFGGPLHFPQRDELAALAGEMNSMCDRLVEADERAAREARARLEMLEQLRHADRLMTVGKLASGVAHEIGTPLNVVQARAAMIVGGETSPAESVDYARVIVRSAERIARIIRQLLTFARRSTLEKSRCDLTLITKHTLELLQSLARKRTVELRLRDGDAPVFVEADGAQIEQVLTNLVMNGVQAMDRPGAVEVQLERVRATPPSDQGGAEGPYVRVRVRDEGRGIAPDHLPHVFEPFFTTKDVGEGTGLGLSIAYGILREHGGWITAQSEPGRGAELTFYLPGGEAAGT
jgi:two-component system NtrC family sensor kinase